MNFAAFALFLVCCHAWAIETNGYPTNQENEQVDFIKFLEKLKEILRVGNETLGMEPLDPYIKDQSQIHIEDIITLDTLFTDINVVGLSDYIISENCDFSLIPPKIILDITLPLVTMNTNYDNITGQIGHYGVSGDQGNINLSVKDTHLVMEIVYKLSEDWERMEVTEVSPRLSLGKLELRIKGIYDDDEQSNMFNFIISETLSRKIEENQPIITDKLTGMFQNLFKDITTKWPFKELLEMMGIDPFFYIGSVAI